MPKYAMKMFQSAWWSNTQSVDQALPHLISDYSNVDFISGQDDHMPYEVGSRFSDNMFTYYIFSELDRVGKPGNPMIDPVEIQLINSSIISSLRSCNIKINSHKHINTVRTRHIGKFEDGKIIPNKKTSPLVDDLLRNIALYPAAVEKVAEHKKNSTIEGLNAYCVCTKVILTNYDITEQFMSDLTVAVELMNASGIYLLNQDFTAGITGSFIKEKFRDNLIQKEHFLFENEDQSYYQTNEKVI